MIKFVNCSYAKQYWYINYKEILCLAPCICFQKLILKQVARNKDIYSDMLENPQILQRYVEYGI